MMNLVVIFRVCLCFSGRILGDVNLNLDDKAAIKARGLWEDWHLRQLIDHPSRTNHVSGNHAASFNAYAELLYTILPKVFH